MFQEDILVSLTIASKPLTKSDTGARPAAGSIGHPSAATYSLNPARSPFEIASLIVFSLAMSALSAEAFCARILMTPAAITTPTMGIRVTFIMHLLRPGSRRRLAAVRVLGAGAEVNEYARCEPSTRLVSFRLNAPGANPVAFPGPCDRRPFSFVWQPRT